MTVTIVLDTAGLGAWSQRRPPEAVVEAMEVVRRARDSRVLVPSVVTVEALTGGARDAAINQTLKEVDVDEALAVDRCRRAARLRQGVGASAVDAIVVEAAERTQAASVITSDPDDISALLDRSQATVTVIGV